MLSREECAGDDHDDDDVDDDYLLLTLSDCQKAIREALSTPSKNKTNEKRPSLKDELLEYTALVTHLSAMYPLLCVL